MDGLSIMNVIIPAIACFIGIKIPRPPGISRDACWSFPDIFWNLVNERFSCFKMDLIVLQISFDFFGGSWMV